MDLEGPLGPKGTIFGGDLWGVSCSTFGKEGPGADGLSVAYGAHMSSTFRKVGGHSHQSPNLVFGRHTCKMF